MSDQLYPDAQVIFRVANANCSTDAEMLWATSLGSNRYLVESSPYWVNGVSLGDVVLAQFEESDGMPTFARIVSKSGNCTIRVLFERPVDDSNQADRVLEGVVRLGCSYAFDASRKKMASINIPIGIDLGTVCNYLNRYDVSWQLVDPGS